VIRAWSTDAVYGAEAALLATLPEGELMARAVEGLALVAAARLEERGGTAVAALVGPGNNGADALYAVARLAAAGWNAVALHHDVVHEGARAAAEASGVVLTTDPASVREADVVLDGILGIGARPGLPPWAVAWVAAVPDSAHVIAVDLPSGQDPMGCALDPDGIFADETVTFSVAKPVHLLPPTEQACGILTVVDIGLELTVDPIVLRLDHDDVASLWPVPRPSDDKYSRGVVGVIAGGEAYTGAALLAVHPDCPRARCRSRGRSRHGPRAGVGGGARPRGGVDRRRVARPAGRGPICPGRRRAGGRGCRRSGPARRRRRDGPSGPDDPAHPSRRGVRPPPHPPHPR
jgi:NAD(P)H-hydrate repair Nnr-like enzyme with NAD(P)H-hydrate epimerase domain